MNHLDLFSGIGGFSLGLKQAGIEPDWIGYSDIDKHANQLFKRRFPNAKELGSITTIQPDKLPKIDLITFGFPCQDLSIAGKRGGLAANRSSLFFEAIKIIQHKKPKYFIFENVKGIFSSNGGKDFDIVLRSIADIGYDGQWELCNTRWYLPQNRERVYFVGHIRGESRPKVFPLGENDKETEDDGKGKRIEIVGHSGSGGQKGNIHSSDGVMSCLTATDYKQPKQIKLNQIATIGEDSEATRVYDTTCARTIKNGGGMGAKTELYKVHSTQTRGADRPSLTKECDCGSGKLKKKCCGASGGSGHLSRKDGNTYCLDTGNTQAVEIEKTNIRRLTPTECERLQGFPDGWTDEQSDTQRYKQLGNAVSVPVVKAIMERLYKGESNAK